jgi:hypothetical protein
MLQAHLGTLQFDQVGPSQARINAPWPATRFRDGQLPIQISDYLIQ